MPLFTYSQSNQIYIDGYFEDWVNINNYTDPNDNIESGVDFTNISVINGDALDQDILTEAGIKNAETFV